MRFARKVVEKIEKQGVFDDIRERAKAEAEKYLEHVSDDTNKEVIRMRLRELIKNYDDQLQRIVDTFMREPWIEAELDKEVQQKVRSIYGLTSE
ncbi:unnamed protein product, partial [Mesorhabditis spiculigera]